MTENQVTLYGAPHSLYTARARSYLIKAGLPYREMSANTPHFQDYVLPKAGGRQSLPTIELSDGQVIRDGAAIIDHFEALAGHPFSPKTPKLRILSRLFDVIGAEGLVRPAMHYRWNFPQENQRFLQFHFEALMPESAARAEQARALVDRMCDAQKIMGVVPDAHDVVEGLYTDVMKALDRHFQECPYLLGGKPSIGDFGLIAPLYGHLGRDPMPLALMQSEAVHLFRWVERMNRPGVETFAFTAGDETYLVDDDVPESLMDVLRVFAEDFVPETRAAAASINEWLDSQTDLKAGTEAARFLGMASFDVRGTPITAAAQPYRFYLLDRVQEDFETMVGDDQESVRQILVACNMDHILQTKLSRGIGRKDNLEVWL